ncbi:universal stress protein [Salinigranum halophilum]|uniref:universal stress protein n=1 Tax=Salinigranum halophilum TaxID=2565931 RepID=UPI001F3F5C42|nr:universal stress protein [Salinigranum halophilum]
MMARGYDNVLLPTDGSEATLAAVEEAGHIAALSGATVHVLSVADTRNRFESPTAGLAVDAWEQAEHERAEAAIDRAVEALPDDVPTERVVRAGIPKTEVLDYVDETDVDLVVMGTHGRTGLDHYLIGSVTERVVRNSPVPVLTVRAEA